MLSGWNKFAGWVILDYFLANPSREVYIRELARILKLSPRTIQVYCDLYETDGVLVSQKKALVKLFRLKNDAPLVRGLKKLHFLGKLTNAIAATPLLAENSHILSLVLYGSYSSGTYDEKSDIDLLIISEKKVNRAPILELQNNLGREIQLTELTLGKWIALKNSHSALALSILSNNTILYGGEL